LSYRPKPMKALGVFKKHFEPVFWLTRVPFSLFPLGIQISKERALQKFRSQASASEQHIQIALALPEVVALLQKGACNRFDSLHSRRRRNDAVGGRRTDCPQGRSQPMAGEVTSRQPAFAQVLPAISGGEKRILEAGRRGELRKADRAPSSDNLPSSAFSSISQAIQDCRVEPIRDRRRKSPELWLLIVRCRY
jgi:hypothetical protein